MFGFVKPCHRAALGGKLVNVLHQGGAVSRVNEFRDACPAEGAYKVRHLVLPKEVAEFKLFCVVFNAACPCPRKSIFKKEKV